MRKFENSFRCVLIIISTNVENTISSESKMGWLPVYTQVESWPTRNLKVFCYLLQFCQSLSTDLRIPETRCAMNVCHYYQRESIGLLPKRWGPKRSHVVSSYQELLVFPSEKKEQIYILENCHSALNTSKILAITSNNITSCGIRNFCSIIDW